MSIGIGKYGIHGFCGERKDSRRFCGVLLLGCFGVVLLGSNGLDVR